MATLTSCGNDAQRQTVATETAATEPIVPTVMPTDSAAAAPSLAAADAELQDTVFAEIKSGATVRGNGKRHTYLLGEGTLFADTTATLLPTAPDKLREVAASINRRYPMQHVRLYASGSASTKLTARRLVVVRDWLLQNARIDAAVENLPLPAAPATTQAASIGIAVNPS